MPVVPSLADGAPGDDRILRWVGHDVIRVVSVQVRGRVDEPGEVQDDAVSESTGDEEGVPEVGTPEVGRNLGRQDVAHVEREPRIELLLEVHGRVLHEIGKVHVASRFDDFGMLLDEQPSHVGEEESSRGVVRVGIGFRILVVDAVIACPVVDAALVGDGVAEHQENSERKPGLVRSVGP